MATKSVGTLSAKLLLDTKGWTGGFAQANKTAASFSKGSAVAAGRSVSNLGTRMLAAGLSIAVLTKAFKTIGHVAARTFANIEKTGGIGLDKIQIDRVVAANKAVRDLALSMQALGDKSAAAVAPAVASIGRGLIDSLESVQRAIQSLGGSFENISGVILKASFGWHMGFRILNNELELMAVRVQMTGAAIRAMQGDKFANVEASGFALRAAVLDNRGANLMNGKGVAGEFGKFMQNIGAASGGGGGAVGLPGQPAAERGSVEAAKVLATAGSASKLDEMLAVLRSINAEQKTARMNPNSQVFGLASI
jgi:ribosomal protein L12E/L44/L45/RPP1/RPP2